MSEYTRGNWCIGDGGCNNRDGECIRSGGCTRSGGYAHMNMMVRSNVKFLKTKSSVALKLTNQEPSTA